MDDLRKMRQLVWACLVMALLSLAATGATAWKCAVDNAATARRLDAIADLMEIGEMAKELRRLADELKR